MAARSMLMVIVGLLALVAHASAQYIYLDADGDGVNTPADIVRPGVRTALDLWLVTDKNRDGGAVRGIASSIRMSVFSYEFVLRADGGEVEWGEYVNKQESMTIPFARRESPHEFYIGYGGLTKLDPGKYRLGQLTLKVKSGSPDLHFASEAAMDPSLWTSFGSENPGIEDDHTIRFGPLADNALRQEARREWGDSDGIKSDKSNLAGALQQSENLRLRVSIVPGVSGSVPVLRVSTGMQGPVGAALFDVRGRLVCRLIDEAAAMPGTRTIDLGTCRGRGSRVPSGIYFYRVNAAKDEVHGKVVLLR